VDTQGGPCWSGEKGAGSAGEGRAARRRLTGTRRVVA
jgi:hypothetical protein